MYDDRHRLKSLFFAPRSIKQPTTFYVDSLQPSNDFSAESSTQTHRDLRISEFLILDTTVEQSFFVFGEDHVVMKRTAEYMFEFYESNVSVI